MERTFHTSQDKLWKAHAQKELFEQWFAPKGWEVTATKFIFEDGGENIYVMKCVDKAQGEWYGQSSAGKMVFKNINPQSSFGYTDYFTDLQGNINESMPASDSLVELQELDGGVTLLRVKTTYKSESELKQVLEMGMKEGYAATLDKLEKLVTMQE